MNESNSAAQIPKDVSKLEAAAGTPPSERHISDDDKALAALGYSPVSRWKRVFRCTHRGEFYFVEFRLTTGLVAGVQARVFTVVMLQFCNEHFGPLRNRHGHVYLPAIRWRIGICCVVLANWRRRRICSCTLYCRNQFSIPNVG